MKQFLLDAILPFITLALGYVLKGRKLKAETEGQELDNIEKAVTIWRELAESLEQKVTLLSKQVETLTVENNILKEKLSALERQISNR